MWRNVKYGAKRIWDRRKRWLKEQLEDLTAPEESERLALHPCVAHRGWSGKAPENTMAAFRLALEEPAVSWIELDVRLSRDEIPVVIHDPVLKRTAGIPSRVNECTAAQLARMDAGSWFHPSFENEGIPALDQVLELTERRCRLNVEIKGEDSPPELAARRVAEAIRARGRVADTVITSFRPQILSAVKEYCPEIATGLIIDGNPPGLIADVRALGGTVLSIGYRHLTRRLLQEAEDAGIAVMAWTVNAPKDLHRLVFRPEPIMVCTNYPDRWLAAVMNQKE